MGTRVMKGACLAAGGLVALLLSGTPAPAQEPIRAISVFPEAETKGMPQSTTIPAPPGFSHVVGAAIANTFVFPMMTVACLSGDVVGFFVGSVLRAPVSAVTLGDRTGVGEELDRMGSAIAGNACSESLFVRPEDLKREVPSPEPMAAAPPQGR